MELFKTSGILDEAVLKELGKKGIPASMNALIIILFIGGIALIFLEKYLLAAASDVYKRQSEYCLRELQ